MSINILSLAASTLTRLDTAFDGPIYHNERTLLEVAVTDPKLWAAAKAKFARSDTRPVYQVASLKFPLCDLPSDVHYLLPAGPNVRDLCKLSATCAFFRKECMLVFDARMRRAFEIFDLNWLEVRFALTQCHAIISGWFIYHLVRMEFSQLMRVTTIDSYVRKGSDADLLGEFLEVATAYEKVERVFDSGVYKNYGVLDTVFYDHSLHPFTITVHRCWEEPRVTVMRGPITCLFSWMCGKGIFIGYPDLTLEGRAIVSHTHVPLRSSSHKQHLLGLELTAAMHGVVLTTFHEGRTSFPTRESCALSLTCPAQSRNSFDSLSFQTIFDNCGWHRGIDRQTIDCDVYWTLGAMDCCVEKSGISFNAEELAKTDRKNTDGRSIYRSFYIHSRSGSYQLYEDTTMTSSKTTADPIQSERSRSIILSMWVGQRQAFLATSKDPATARVVPVLSPLSPSMWRTVGRSALRQLLHFARVRTQ
ncbi:hypothetical protein B0H12DRAFT_1078332 [Mycena haematopus]|nr:hypothetical protein B0H12DRAFT_1078332 [Mycena haematopus]